MSEDASAPGRGGDAARRPTIGLDELTWALNSRNTVGECSHWLIIESGEALAWMATTWGHRRFWDQHHRPPSGALYKTATSPADSVGSAPAPTPLPARPQAPAG